jgi:hypothetical protein
MFPSFLTQGQDSSMKKPVEIIEINAVEPEPINDPHYDVKLVRGGLVGDKVHPPGACVKLPERAAIGAIKDGAAIPHGVRSTLILGQFVKAAPSSEPKPAPGQAVAPNIRVKSGSLLQGSRSYTAADPPFHYFGDVVRLLAESDPIPGSLMEAYVRKLSRHRAVVELVIPLSAEGSARLARLRRNPSEPEEGELTAAKRMAELAGVCV